MPSDHIDDFFTLWNMSSVEDIHLLFEDIDLHKNTFVNIGFLKWVDGL